MSQNLIHIKDIINNKEFIYNTDYNLEYGFLKCFESIVKKDLNIKKNVKYAIYENYCEIYYDEEIVKKGWVWNSQNIEKHIIYILRYIPIYQENIKTNVDNKEVEAIVEKTDRGTTMIKNEWKYNRYYYSKDSEDEDSEDSQDNNNNESNTVLEKDILDDLVPLLCKDDTFIESINWCYSELEPIIENFDNLNLGNGYANNPLFPKELNIELKDKLSRPNFGLKSIV